MKKLIVIAIALITVQSFAQQPVKARANNPDKGQRMYNLSPEEAATLQTKKMVLSLDLNEKQQKDIYKINLENATKRQEMIEAFKTKRESGQMQKPSKEERLSMANAKLDHQIAMKGKMKSILNADQYAKWEKMQQRMASKEKGMRKDNANNHGKRPQKQG